MKKPLLPKASKLPNPKRQRGAVLAIALILLVVVTLLGLSNIKTVGQQEKMAAHSNDRSLAYQFAEAALREGEAQARIQSQNINVGFPIPLIQYLADGQCTATSINDCSNGLCATPDPDCPARWTDPMVNNLPAFNRWTQFNGVAAITNAGGNVLSGVPEYFIEILRPTDTLCAPGAQTFDMACNQRYPDPDNAAPLCSPVVPMTGMYLNGQYQVCSFYRYRVTACIQVQGRAAVILQSVLSVQPN